MDPFQIRPAARADAEAAADVWLESRRGARELIPPPAHSEAEIREWIASRVIAELECWVAETPDRKLVGLLALDDEWVDQLCVLTRSQARGIGGALLAHAKRRRPDGLALWTFASNLPARRFYGQRGFVAVGQTVGADNEEHAPDVRYAWVPIAGP